MSLWQFKMFLTFSVNSFIRMGFVSYPSDPAAMICRRSRVVAEAVTAITGIL